MKLELGIEKPKALTQKWEGQYDIFSWMEYVSAIPQRYF